MPKTEQDALARAIEYLGAVKIASGGDHTPDGGLVMTDLYAYREPEGYGGKGYGIVNSDDLATLVVLMSEDTSGDGPDLSVREAYYEWCLLTRAVPMPSWWSPERLFAWRSVDDEGNASSAGDKPYADYLTRVGGGRTVKVTASLDDGSEIPA